MGKKQKKLNRDHREFWKMVIETWRDSGLTVSKFCKAEGLSEGSFYNWRKKMAKGDEPEPEKQNVPEPTPFIKVSMPNDNSTVLELFLSSGHTLRIGPGTDDNTLNNVLSALKRAQLC